MVLAPLALAQQPAANDDPGFEAGGAAWVGERLSFAPGTSLRRGRDGTASPRSGAFGFSISNHAQGGLESDPVPITGNTAYDVSAWLRGEIAPQASDDGWAVEVEFYDAADAPLGRETVAGGAPGSVGLAWQRVKGRASTPAGAASLRLRLALRQAAGWVAFDDVELRLGAGDNLLPNPGFEDGAAGWAEHRADHAPGTALRRGSWGTEAPRTGRYAWSISNHAHGYVESSAVPVSAFTDYDVSGWVRGEIDPAASQNGWLVRVMFHDAAGTPVGHADPAQGGPGSLGLTWQQLAGRVTAPAGAASLRVRLYLYQAVGWVAFDDVEVRSSPDGGNLLRNPGFEDGTAGWAGFRASHAPGTSFWQGKWGMAGPRSGAAGYSISNQAYGFLLSSPIDVAPATDYDLTAWVRGEIAPEASQTGWLMRVSFHDATGAWLSHTDPAAGAPGSTDPTWRRVGGRLAVPPDAVSARIRLYLYQATGWVAFDDVTLVPAQDPLGQRERDARFLSQDVPATLAAGETRQVAVTLRNAGTVAWSPGAAFRLGSQSPADSTTWGFHRVMLAPGERVAPGQYKTFVFAVTAPETPGTYTFRWRMVQDGVEWFGDATPPLQVEAVRDTVPPQNPPSLSATIDGRDAASAVVTTPSPTLELRWPPAQDPAPGSGVAAYQVVLQRRSDNAWLYSPVLGNVTEYVLHAGLAAGESYHYWVRSRDKAGNWGMPFRHGGTFTVASTATALPTLPSSDYSSCDIEPRDLSCSNSQYSLCVQQNIWDCEHQVEYRCSQAMEGVLANCLGCLVGPSWKKFTSLALLLCVPSCGLELLEFIECRARARGVLRTANRFCACDHCPDPDPRCTNGYGINLSVAGLQCNEAVYAHIQCGSSATGDPFIMTDRSPDAVVPNWCHHTEPWSVQLGRVFDLTTGAERRSCTPPLQSGPAGSVTSVSAQFDCSGAPPTPTPLVASASCMPENSYFRLRVSAEDACGTPVGTPASVLVSWDDSLERIPLGLGAPPGSRVSSRIIEDSGGCFNDPMDVEVAGQGAAFEVTHVQCDSACARTPRTFTVGGTVEGLPEGAQITVVGRFFAPPGRQGFKEERLTGRGNGSFHFQGIENGWQVAIGTQGEPTDFRCFVLSPTRQVDGASIYDVAIACFEVTEDLGPLTQPGGEGGVCDPFWSVCDAPLCITDCESEEQTTVVSSDVNGNGKIEPDEVQVIRWEVLTCVDRCVDGAAHDPFRLRGPYVSVGRPAAQAVVSGNMPIDGWSTDADGVSGLVFLVDGRRVQLAGYSYGEPAPQACRALESLGAATCNPASGFAGVLDTNGLPEGGHLLQVMSFDSHPTHPRMTVARIPFTVRRSVGGLAGIRVTHGATTLPDRNQPAFDFGRHDVVTCQDGCAERDFVIHNDRDQPLDVADFSAPGGYGLGAVPARIPARSQATFGVRLLGSHPGTFGGQVTFQVSSPGEPAARFHLNLTGTVTDNVCGSDHAPPSAAITSPLDGATLDASAGTVTIAASAADPAAGVEHVAFLVDGVELGTDRAAPFEHAWTAQVGSHELSIRAQDRCGNRSYHAIRVQVTSTAPGAVPGFSGTIDGAPLAGLTVYRTDPLVELTWSPASHSSGIERYQVVLQPTNGSGWLYQPHVVAPATRHTLATSGLAYGTSYSVHLRAKNGAGVWGPFVNGGSFHVAAAVPPPQVPVFVSRIHGLDSSGLSVASQTPVVTFEWTAPSDPFGVDRHQVVIQRADGTGWLYDPHVLAPATSHTIQTAGLQWDVAYSTHIRARNRTGLWGPWRRGGTFTVRQGVAPGPVQGFAGTIDGQPVPGLAVDGTAPAVQLGWNPLTDAFGVERYQVVLQPADGSGWLYDPHVLAPATSHTLHASGLVREKTYSIHLRAKNHAGLWGPFVHGGSFTVRPLPPAAPSGLTAVYEPAAQGVVLRWVDNSNNEEAFQAQYSHAGGAFTNLTPATIGPNVTTAIFGPTPAVGPYEFRVRAQGALGTRSAWSNVARATVAGPPSVVPGFRATIGGADASGHTVYVTDPQLQLSWSHASHALGIERYHIVVQATDGSTGWLYGPNAMFPATAHTLSTHNLVRGKDYSFHIRAKSTDGQWGPFVNGGSFAVREPPAAPAGLTATYDAGPQRILLGWTDTSAGELGFQVQFSYSGSGFADLSPASVGPNVTTYTVGPLAAFGYYEFRVRALGAAGVVSGWSGTAGVVATGPPSEVPSFRGTIGGLNLDGRTVHVTNPVLQFTWAPASHPLGIERYHIVVQATDGSGGWLYGPNVLHPGTSHTLATANLVPGKSYSIHIRAKSSDGQWGLFVGGGAFSVATAP